MSVEPSAPRGAWHEHRFTMLLGLLVLNIAIAPFVASLSVLRSPGLGIPLVAVSFTALILAAAVWTTEARTSRRLALILALGAVAGRWLPWGNDGLTERLVDCFTTMTAVAYVVALLVRYVFQEREVTSNVISASLCGYLFIGFAWASVYMMIELLQPGSFHLPDDGQGDFLGGSNNFDATIRRIYFSFVTLLTLGYGDVVPVGAAARLLATLEAFIGQVYLIVLVARLVGVQVGQNRADAGSPRDSTPSAAGSSRITLPRAGPRAP